MVSTFIKSIETARSQRKAVVKPKATTEDVATEQTEDAA